MKLSLFIHSNGTAAQDTSVSLMVNGEHTFTIAAMRDMLQCPGCEFSVEGSNLPKTVCQSVKSKTRLGWEITQGGVTEYIPVDAFMDVPLNLCSSKKVCSSLSKAKRP